MEYLTPVRGLRLLLTFGLFMSANESRANLGHWRYVFAERVRVFSSSEPNGREIGFSAFASIKDQCISRIEHTFPVPDIAETSEIVYQPLVGFESAGDRISIECRDSHSGTIFEIGENIRTDSLAATNIPLACADSGTLRLSISSKPGECLDIDRPRLVIKSHFRRNDLKEVLLDEGRRFSRCDEPCRETLRDLDGVHANDRICVDRLFFRRSRDFVFNTLEHESIRSVLLEASIRAETSRAEVELSCIETFTGSERALDLNHALQLNGTSQMFRLPLSCVQGPETVVRARTRGSGCVWVDQLSLLSQSDIRARYPRRFRGRGKCNSPEDSQQVRECLDRVAINDGVWEPEFVCADQEYDNSRLEFHLADHRSVHGAFLAVRAKGSKPDALLNAVCHNLQGVRQVQMIESQRFERDPDTRWFEIPDECLTGYKLSLEFSAEGEGCIALDFARVFSSSDQETDRDEVLAYIAAYSNVRSVARGDAIDLFLHSQRGSVSVEIYRFGDKRQKMLTIDDVPARIQSENVDAYKNGSAFEDKISLEIPRSWPSGLYGVKVEDDQGDSMWVAFAVTVPNVRERAKNAVLLSTNTWNAYNTWGGASLYKFLYSDESRRRSGERLAFDRPDHHMNPGAEDPFDEHQKGSRVGGERWLMGWLERNSISYDVLAASDLHRYPDALAGYSNVVINTHGEYWTEQMRDALDSHLDRGGSLTSLGGNGVYWKSTIAGMQLETHKRETNHYHDGTRGGLWASVGRSEAAILGSRYDSRGYGTCAPYEVLLPDHPLFEGFSVEKGQLIGGSGRPSTSGIGASGWETDKVTEDTPKHAEIIAKGTNPDGGGADMVYFDHSGGGAVFSAGSITYVKSLGYDTAIDHITKKFLALSSRKIRSIEASQIESFTQECPTGTACTRFTFSFDPSERISYFVAQVSAENPTWRHPVDIYCSNVSDGLPRWLGAVYPNRAMSARPIEIDSVCIGNGSSLVLEIHADPEMNPGVVSLVGLQVGIVR